jgi:hypothetical protein
MIRYRAVTQWWAVGLLSLVLFATTSCRSVEKIAVPSSQVLGVRLVEQTPYGARLDIIVGLANPNLVALPLVNCDYAITIEGVGSYRFSDQPHKTLPAGLESGGGRLGLQELRLPVAIEHEKGDLAGTAFKVHGTVLYEPPSEVQKLLMESNFALPKVEFFGTGQVQ